MHFAVLDIRESLANVFVRWHRSPIHAFDPSTRVVRLSETPLANGASGAFLSATLELSAFAWSHSKLADLAAGLTFVGSVPGAHITHHHFSLSNLAIGPSSTSLITWEA